MLQRKTASNGVVYYSSPLLEKVGVSHAFSTRIGGVSKGPFQSLNLGHLSGCSDPDTDENIEENYRRLQAAIGCEGKPRCSVYQVHGAGVLRVAGGGKWDRMQQADAMYTEDSERMLAVRVADCVPVLLATSDGKYVAAIHSGWRGVVAGVVPATIQAMGQPAADLIAAIGPCIGPDFFEVGLEVIEEFTRVFGDRAPFRRLNAGKGLIDLPAAIQMQLISAGVPLQQIDRTDRCTFRDADEFYSHRRDRGITGRMAAVISPRKP